MTIDDLKEKFEFIKNLGFVQSKRNGPTGIGYTFESLLGIGENKLTNIYRKVIDL